MRLVRRQALKVMTLAPALGLAACGGSDDVDPTAEVAGHATVNGQRLYYVTLGGGTPVVFMHGGLGFDHQYFRPFFDGLASSAKVVYYDHLGHGQSDRPSDFSAITLARLSADCDALTTALGLGKFVLVGHSYGGFIALDFALRYPGRLLGLVLSCTAGDLASFVLRAPLGGTTAQQAALGRLFTAGANDTDTALRANWVGALPLYYNNASVPAALSLNEIDARTVYSAAGFNRGNAILGGYDFIPRLGEINVPTFVHYGAGDIWRFGDTEKLARGIRGATLKYYAGSGHWPFQEEQAAFLRDMRGFVASVS